MAYFSQVPMGRERVLDIFPHYLIYTLIIILAIALIFYWLTKNARKKETATEILKKRYAGGEIDRETFNQMKEDLAE
jgi:putative membrane protein